MSAELLAAVAGILLSLAFSYIPGLNAKFAGLVKEQKQLIMLGVLALAAAVVFGLSCTSWGSGWGIAITCDQKGAQELTAAFVAALVANQGAFLISPEAKSVRTVKAAKANG